MRIPCKEYCTVAEMILNMKKKDCKYDACRHIYHFRSLRNNILLRILKKTRFICTHSIWLSRPADSSEVKIVLCYFLII